MSAETSNIHMNQLRPQAGALSFLIFICAVLVLAATVFSSPFPLVRPSWIQEALGLTGIVNGIFLVLLAYHTERMQLPAAIGGLGLILNDQVFIWRGFIILLTRQEANQQVILFLITAVLADLFLLGLFILTARLIWKHHNLKKRITAADPAGSLVQNESAEFSPLIVSSIIYIGFFLGVYGALSLTPKYNFVVLKGVAQLAGLLSFVGLGVELDYYVKGQQNKLLCGIKMFSHFIMLASIFWVTYRLMPIAKMII